MITIHTNGALNKWFLRGTKKELNAFAAAIQSKAKLGETSTVVFKNANRPVEILLDDFEDDNAKNI